MRPPYVATPAQILLFMDGFEATRHISFTKFGVFAHCYSTTVWRYRPESMVTMCHPMSGRMLHRLARPDFHH